MGYKPEPASQSIYTLQARIVSRPTDKRDDEQPHSGSAVVPDPRHQRLGVAAPRFRVARLLSFGQTRPT